MAVERQKREPATEKGRRPGWVVWSLAIALLLLAAVEAGSFLVLRLAGASPASNEGHIQYYDGLCGWRYFTPDGFRWVDYSSASKHSTLILLDKWGFNTTAEKLTLHKQPGEIRLAFTGASATFGIGCRKPEWSVPSRFQAELRRRHPGRDIKVINACVRGYNSFQQFTYYLLYVRSFSPDVVISVVGSNDLKLPPRQGRQGVSQPVKSDYMQAMDNLINQMEQNKVPPGIGEFIAYYASRTNTGQLLDRVGQRFGAGNWVTNALTALERQDSPEKGPRPDTPLELGITARTMLNTLMDYRGAVENQAGHFMGVLRPVAALGKPLTKDELGFVQDEQGRPTVKTKRRRIFYGLVSPRMAQERAMYDLSQVFADQGGKTLYEDLSHYNPDGAALFARALADQIEKQAWFQALLARSK
ncbi:MAG: SGNH/GDSL hydrolase family protein [Desulfarculaceae bacterium]|nr:SGNH/GDSL hydrolase family protein [Desulfarculaceae bacterium]